MALPTLKSIKLSDFSIFPFAHTVFFVWLFFILVQLLYRIISGGVVETRYSIYSQQRNPFVLLCQSTMNDEDEGRKKGNSLIKHRHTVKSCINCFYGMLHETHERKKHVFLTVCARARACVCVCDKMRSVLTPCRRKRTHTLVIKLQLRGFC